MEGRYYRPFGNYLVWAQALRLVYVASLREDRSLPRAYWKVFGGDGTVRGVERNRILDADGGRVGMNLRSELRFKYRDLGLVAFWDRANVWHRTGDADPFEMIDGFGTGLRYTMGIPFRIDFAFNDGFDKSRDYWFYFSVGQAFWEEQALAAFRRSFASILRIGRPFGCSPVHPWPGSEALTSDSMTENNDR